MSDLLIDCLVGVLQTVRSYGWLIGCLNERLTGRAGEGLVDWLERLLVGWLFPVWDWLGLGWLIWSLVGWLFVLVGLFGWALAWLVC